MKKKILPILLALLLPMGLIATGCPPVDPVVEEPAVEEPTPGEQPVPAPSPEPVPDPAAEPELIPEPEPIELSGHGDAVSPEFILDEGITVIIMTHDGQAGFAIWLFDVATGERVDLLVNEIGPFSGSAVVGVTGEILAASPGRHLLDITADGNWEVTIEQPRPTTAPTAPQSFTGRGYGVSPPFMLETGIATFEMTHDGQAGFAIWLYDKDGYRIDLLVNEIGAYSGSKVVGVTGKIFDASPGIHYLAITADGNWTVSINQ